MNRLTRVAARCALPACLFVALAQRADAQLVSASATSLSVADNYTVLARGFNAVAWNPANLGLPGNPLLSFGFAGRGSGGMDPISLSDLAQYGGVPLPNAVMSEWLARVRHQGGQSLEAEGAGSFAMSIGSFALQLSTTGYERGKL